MTGLVVTGGRRMVGQQVRPGRGGGIVVRQGGGHCGTVAGQGGGQTVVTTVVSSQGRVVARRLTDTDHLLLPVGVRLLVLPVVRGRDVDLNVNGVREEP